MLIDPESVRRDILTALPRGPRPAVIGKRERITYDELHGRANQVAHALLEAGEGEAPGAVALLLDHGPAAIVGALGALKAGGHYVALDPRGPVERAAFVLTDSAAGVIVTQPAHAEAARHLALRCERPPAIVDLQAMRKRPTADPVRAPTPSDRALLVYTSGSTGQPKGVWHDHASIAGGADTYAALVGLGPEDRLSLLHGLTTMAAATTLWAGLLSGSAIVPIDPRRGSREQLLARIESTGVTGLHLVPTLFRRLADGEVGQALSGLRFVRLGGEPITGSDWALWRACCHPASRLHVGYASTEVGLVRHDAYDHGSPAGESLLPIGGPVPGKEVQVVNARGEPVATGEVGRVVVRGDHLFGGYHGREEETAAVRSVDPDDGRAVFESGDLARFDEHGRLFHAGRADAQVKIDGHRVEPAETEHALRGLPWVRDAAVVTRPHANGSPRLAAYVVAEAADPIQRRLVRANLRERLPAPMVPATVEALKALPLLPDGKVDRRALAARPAPAAPPPRPPRNPIEETLLEIWERVLDQPVLGVDADFFLDLGGDSLDAVQILNEVGEVFGRELTLEVLHHAPTVSELAARLIDDGWRPSEDGVLSVNRAGAKAPLFGVCGIFGHALRLTLIGQALDSEQPLHALQPPGMDWSRAGCETINAMAAHYRSVIQRIQPSGPYRLLGTSFGGVLAFEIARGLEAEGERVGLLAMVDSTPPDCDLGDGIDRAPRVERAASVKLSDPLQAMGARVAHQHEAAMSRHRLTTPFGGEIVYLRCEEPEVEPRDDRRELWARFAAGGVRKVPIPGRHLTFHREPQFSAIVGELRRRLSSEVPVA